MSKNTPHISVVSPVYKAEASLSQLVERTSRALEAMNMSYEIILVDDRSPDESWTKIVELSRGNSRIRGIRLSKNSGQQHAIQAGLDASFGLFVVTLDCDLQDKPEELPKLYDKAIEGFEIVAARRENRKDGFLKKAYSKIFYTVLGYLSETKQDNSIANFMLYHRKAVDAMAMIGDRVRYYPMLSQIIGFNYTTVLVEHAKRDEGGSSYTFRKRLSLAMNTILTFSDKLLRLTVYSGCLLALVSFIALAALLVAYLVSDTVVQGWASLSIVVSMFSGIIITIVGVVGLYVGKTFESVKQRPTYIVDQTVGKL